MFRYQFVNSAVSLSLRDFARPIRNLVFLLYNRFECVCVCVRNQTLAKNDFDLSDYVPLWCVLPIYSCFLVAAPEIEKQV